MSPWNTCEEDPELNTPTDVADSDARHWLQLSPTDASNLTGATFLLNCDTHIDHKENSLLVTQIL